MRGRRTTGASPKARQRKVLLPRPSLPPSTAVGYFEGPCRSRCEQRTMVPRRNGDGRRSFPAIAGGDEGRVARRRTSFGRRLGEAPHSVLVGSYNTASPKRRPEDVRPGRPGCLGPAVQAALHLRLSARAERPGVEVVPGRGGCPDAPVFMDRECRHGDCKLCGATQGNYEGEIPPAKHSPTNYRDRKWSQLQSNPAKIPYYYRGTATTGPPTERDLPPLVPLAETPGALS